MIVNGQEQRHINIADRAVQYGDGCFTTMAYRNGRLECFEAHIERLQLACQRLSIQFESWSELIDCVIKTAKSSKNCVIKIIISRGEGGRGYSPRGALKANYIITQHPLPVYYNKWQSTGIRLTQSAVTLARQPLLAGIKHLNRLEQVLIKHSLEATRYDDAVVCDLEGAIVESSIGNLFWRNGNTWFTPNLDMAGVEGVMRNQLLALMGEKKLQFRIVSQQYNQLFDADEIFICNSLLTLVPVKQLFFPDTQETKFYTMDNSLILQRLLLDKIQHEAIAV